MSRKWQAHFTDPKSILLANEAGNGILAEGATVPTDGGAGYATGCIFIHNDGAEDTALYVNDGSATSCDFNALATASTATSTELSLLSGLLATAAEINRTCDVSTRLIAAGGTLTLTVAAHDGKTILLDTAAGSVVTLPAATGTGAIFKFVVSVIATSNSHIVKVANASDIIQGIILAISDAGNAELGWIAGATADTITLDRSTTGSVTRGEFLEIQDVATNLFVVKGSVAQTGTEATPFSATV